MRLSHLKNNEEGIITKVRGRGAFRKRIMEMGFVKGKKVKVIKNAPLKDPIEYSIMSYEVSLRRSEAQHIEIVTIEEAKKNGIKNFNGTATEEFLVHTARAKGKHINVALVGNPNCGKTTLFNHASHSREHVGNYGGVTIDSKIATFKQGGYTFELIDLPGTYSLSAYSPEEIFVRKHIFGKMPDVVINVVDASNLERNLFLTTQLIDMDIRVVMALNMYDEHLKQGDHFDYNSLGKMIGIPILPTTSSKGSGIKQLFDKVIDVFEDRDPHLRHVHIKYEKPVEDSLKILQDLMWENKTLTDKVSSRFYAIKLLEKDKAVHFSLSRWPNYKTIVDTTKRKISGLENQYKEDTEALITDARYGFIAGALKETYKSGTVEKNITKRIDDFMTHKLFGFPIFFIAMFIMFFSTFELGKFPMQWLEIIISWFSGWLNGVMPDGPLKALLADGIVNGVGSVIVFLPNILILFFFISLMEDTGYMARAAFIMDKVMHKIGLHGKSFIPLIMGFGCNVPAIMATRSIENRNNRLLTILINPFMSCSARLPVYILIIGAFFPKNPGIILFLLYFTGVILAAIVAVILKKIFFRTEEVPFVMELPPYRVPTINSTLRHMWNKGFQYLKKMGGVILVASIIIWALGYYPRNVSYTIDYDNMIEETIKQGEKERMLVSNTETGALKRLELQKNSKIETLRLQQQAEHQEKSYIGQIGYFIEPVIKPLGFDWRMGVCLLSGVAAKEIVVSTMAVLYQAGVDADGKSETLTQKIKEIRYSEGERKGDPVFNPLVALAFLIFILVYFPCVAVIAAIKKETGSWKWAAFTIVYTTGLAWILSFIVYQVGSLFV